MNRKRNIAIFLLTISIFLFIANTIVYKAFLLIFDVSCSLPAIIILAGLAVSFLISNFLGMKYYNAFTRIYYTLALVWMGLFGYLFIASALYIVEFVFIGDPSRIFALILFGTIKLAIIYGLFHARKLVVKHVTVQIPALPEIWRNRKVVFISDLHIGQINGKKFIEKITTKINDIRPDIIFIGGDLFDGGSSKGILEAIHPLKNLSAPLGTYFIAGNHEAYGNANKFFHAISNTGIKILNDEKIIIDGIQIIGVDYVSTSTESHFKEILTRLHTNKSIPSILLKHEPRHIHIAEEAGISLQISGHTHKAQQWPFEYVARMTYGRFSYGLQLSGATQIYTSSGVGTWGPPIRIGTNAEIVVFNFV